MYIYNFFFYTCMFPFFPSQGKVGEKRMLDEAITRNAKTRTIDLVGVWLFHMYMYFHIHVHFCEIPFVVEIEKKNSQCYIQCTVLYP